MYTRSVSAFIGSVKIPREFTVLPAAIHEREETSKTRSKNGGTSLFRKAKHKGGRGTGTLVCPGNREVVERERRGERLLSLSLSLFSLRSLDGPDTKIVKSLHNSGWYNPARHFSPRLKAHKADWHKRFTSCSPTWCVAPRRNTYIRIISNVSLSLSLSLSLPSATLDGVTVSFRNGGNLASLVVLARVVDEINRVG